MEEVLADLRIEDEEESGGMEAWEFDQGEGSSEQISNLCLVGCFLTATAVNFLSMRMVVVNIWHPLGEVTITGIGEKIFLYRFYCEVDRDREINGSPWTFNNHLLFLHVLKDDEDPLEISLLYTTFWVQVHNLPTGNCNLPNLNDMEKSTNIGDIDMYENQPILTMDDSNEISRKWNDVCQNKLSAKLAGQGILMKFSQIEKNKGDIFEIKDKWEFFEKH
ncbi:hypothetical protein GOBAR_AA05243 [Gossypium barbadense]|uniref:DUF4283 domain-containing protein n=1 Tax=Gossypium barbadense TaxID=3634 RepID=A0A2P5YIA6_GOSBA|nr:hypothetical protein GOBAR_AA05243 [Gossypium barbadense]